jgi:hypothetical protein
MKISFINAVASIAEASAPTLRQGAQRDQVLFGIVAGMAAKLFVVDFQVRHRAARLTPPAVATQDLLPQSFVGHGSSRRRLGFGLIELMMPSRSGLPEMPAAALRAET